MKISDLNQIIENVVSQEVRRAIIKESMDNKKEVYHIKCEGVPLASFNSEAEAKEALPHYKAKHKKGELIIEKGVYESHDDMLDKLDEMNDQLEETDNMENIQKEPMEGNEFSGALKAAKDAGEKTFTVDGKEYDVEECWSKQMEEELHGNQDKIDANHDGKISAADFKLLLKNKKENKEEEECKECGGDMNEHPEDDDNQYQRLEESKCCDECGQPLNEMGVCNECGGMMNETKKKKVIKLTESELTALIAKMVNESIPGLDAYKKAHKESGEQNNKEMDDMMKDVNKNHIDIEGSDKPEFPHPNGKGEKVARENTKEQDEEVAKNFAGLQNLDYDIEPSEKFKERLKMSILGDKLMGNAPTTEKTNVEASNGAKAEENEHKQGNTIETPETGEKIEKQMKDREEDKEKRVLYPKEKVPIKTMNESKISFSSVLEEEIKKMKSLTAYNKKTQ